MPFPAENLILGSLEDPLLDCPWSVSTLSALLGVSQNTIRVWVNGERADHRPMPLTSLTRQVIAAIYAEQVALSEDFVLDYPDRDDLATFNVYGLAKLTELLELIEDELIQGWLRLGIQEVLVASAAFQEDVQATIYYFRGVGS